MIIHKITPKAGVSIVVFTPKSPEGDLASVRLSNFVRKPKSPSGDLGVNREINHKYD